MFAYCNNNPVNWMDPDGHCKRFLGFLWWVDCGKTTCRKSKNYKPSPEKAAVLYDGRSSGWFGGLFGGVGFEKQGKSLVASLQPKYEVESYSFETMDEFVSSWNSLSGEYDVIYVLSHGYPGGLSCAGKSIAGPDQEDFSFWDLNSVSAKTLYLYSCNGATLPAQGNSAAYYLSCLTGGKVHAVINGNLGYKFGSHVPVLQNGGTWSVTSNGITSYWN